MICSLELTFPLSSYYCHSTAVDGSVLHLAAQLIVMIGEHFQPFIFHHIVNQFYSDD